MPKPEKKPKRRRARGTGTIFPAVRRGRKIWIGRRPIGRNAAGKTLYREVWADTQGEVVKKLAEAGPPPPGLTVADWVARWLKSVQVKPRTEANYRDDFTRHILPEIGHLRLAEVSPSQIEALIAALGKKGLGVNSVRKALKHARIAFNAAVRDRIIASNPVSLARKPQAKPKRIDAFTPAELARIITEASIRPHEWPIAVLAGTGCRGGECIALDVQDFDRTAHTVKITKTYHKTAGMGTPKSARSVRTIRVPLVVVPIVEAAIEGRKKGPMFLTTNGTRRSHDLVHHAWQDFIKRIGLAYRNPHQLRHSVATALISAAVPLGDVAAYLGDSVDTVVKTYLHPAGTDPSKALDMLYGEQTVNDATKKGSNDT